MSNNPSEFSSLLKNEPTEPSPAELDDKILRYARENVPEGQPESLLLSVYRRWVPVLASLSIVAIAVLLVVQQPDPMKPNLIKEPAIESVASGQPAGIQKQAEVRQESDELAATRPQSMLNDTVSAEAFAPATVKEQKQRMSKRALEARTVGLKQENSLSSEAVVDRQVQQRLKNIQLTWQAGQTEQAINDYQVLKADCPECELPEELQDALKMLR